MVNQIHLGLFLQEIEILLKKYLILTESYFEEINTPEKAYFLGLLFADGCNQEELGVVSIELQEKDVFIIEKLKLAVGITNPLQFRSRTFPHSNSYRLCIYSKKVSNDLANKGMIARKSLVLEFPKFLSKELYPHFIRGYFDGDGSIYESPSRIFNISIVGTLDICKNIQQIFTNELGLRINKLEKHGDYIFKLRYGGNTQCSKIFNYLYSDSDLHLNRKYEKFQSIPKKNLKRNNQHFNMRCIIDTVNNTIYVGLEEASAKTNIKKHTLQKMLLGKQKNTTNLIYGEKVKINYQ